VHGIKGANEYQSVPNKAKRKRRQMKLQSPLMNTRSKAVVAKWGVWSPIKFYFMLRLNLPLDH